MYNEKYSFSYLLRRIKNATTAVIVGVGEDGKKLLKKLQREDDCKNHIVGCDNNPLMHGKFFLGVLVDAVEKIVRSYPDATYIVCSTNYREELVRQLKSLGIKADCIVVFYTKKPYEYYCQLETCYYEKELQDDYYRTFGKYMSLDPPRTYNEKIMWQMLYSKDKKRTDLADKYKVRKWIKEKIGAQYLNPLIGVWKSAEDIDFSILPKQFVFKLNHGAGWNIIVEDKAKLNITDTIKQLNFWKTQNFAYYNLEMHYSKIEPCILCEKYLENKDHDLYDYKVFCFNGVPEYIMFLTDRKKGLKMAFYDTNWKKQPFVYSYPMIEESVLRPKQLEELLSLSGKLAKGFPQVRVDWYILNDGSIIFSEMTFTSCAGKMEWNPEKYDQILGDMIDGV